MSLKWPHKCSQKKKSLASRFLLTGHKPVTTESQFNLGLKRVEWLEDNQRELAKVVQSASGIVALLGIIKVFHLGSKQPPIHS